MFDPQMLMNMLGMNGGMNNLFGGGQQSSDGQNAPTNPFENMFGGNANMLSGLMQMMNNNSQPQSTGKNTYVNKVSNNNNVNLELYHIIKNSESIS